MATSGKAADFSCQSIQLIKEILFLSPNEPMIMPLLKNDSGGLFTVFEFSNFLSLIPQDTFLSVTISKVLSCSISLCTASHSECIIGFSFSLHVRERLKENEWMAGRERIVNRSNIKRWNKFDIGFLFAVKTSRGSLQRDQGEGFSCGSSQRTSNRKSW